VRRPTKSAARYFIGICALWVLLVFANVARGQNTVSTVAGSAPPNNVGPTAAPIEGPVAVTRDASGNLYVVTDIGVIYKVTSAPPSSMSIYVGNNTAGFSSNGTLATAALLYQPIGAALDVNGNLYFSDQNNCVVREIVAASGVINIVAGIAGQCSYNGDNIAATGAQLNFPQEVALDGSGNLYIADIGNNVVRRVVLGTGIITTYAGTPGTAGFPTNNVLATSTTLNGPIALAVDTAGNLFIADQNADVVCRVDATTKNITIVAGTGTLGFSGDGSLATAADLQVPEGVAVDSAGNLYIADSENARIREVFSPTNPNTPNVITTIVGNGTFGFNGDGAATSIELTNPFGLFVDPASGNLWIADYWSNRVRMYNATANTVTTVVGNGAVGDGGSATSASLYYPRNPALDADGDLYLVDAQNNRVREISASDQTITTVVGTGIPCARPSLPCGDGGPAAEAALFQPRTVTIEPSGILIVADDGDNRIREVDTAGTITTIVGSGNLCTTPFSTCGDGGPALSASLNDARGAVLDAAGNLYFVDAQDNRVREVDTTGTITTVAGNGPDGNAPVGCVQGGNFSGDGGPAVSATLACPLGLDIDASGNLYVADTNNNVIRKIDTGTPRIITTIAGTSEAGNTGDGGLATNATLRTPDRVSVNGAGNFFISDSGNNVIRRVDGTSKIITAFAGNGTFAFAGDGGPALSASFATPVGVVVTPEGNMYVGDVFNNRIRKVLLNPNIALSSTTAAFANQAINVSATLPVTLTNSGDAPLAISDIAITEGAFSLATSTTPCPAAPTTLAIGARCEIDVAFMPSQFIAYTGTVTISDNAPTAGSTQTINLSGMGAAALTVTVSGAGTVASAPAGINCPTTCSATFAGNSAVVLTATAGTGSTFTSFSSNCTAASPQTNPPSCTVTMSAAETVTATFNTAATGSISIAPMTLTFGSQAMGTTSVTQTVTVSNTGGTTVTFTNIVTSGDFAGATLVQCPSIAVEGTPCTFQISFKPTATGTRTGAITFTDNATGSPQSVTLTGTGTAATGGTITITPTPLPFGLEGLGSTSSPETLTVSNTGNTAVTFTSIVTSGDFAGATLAQCLSIAVDAKPCTFQITFTPTAAGVRNGTIVFTDNATGSPQTVTLTGTGVAVAIGIAPTALTFGSQAVGTTSAAQTVTVSNNGNFPLFFNSIVTSGDFAGATLAQCPSIGEEAPPCVFSITFKPTATGTRTGAITFTDTGTGSPQTVTLTGTGTPGTATVTVTPNSLAFGSQALSTTSAPMSVTVTNTSNAAVNFAGFTTSGADAEDFSVPLPSSGAGCSPAGTLAAGASCAINVVFTPQANGARTATLNIADNATGSPQAVALSGTGVTSQVIITVPPGGSTTATTVSGGTAYYGLVIQGASGVTGTVQLGCVPSSVLITCKVIPGSVILTGGSTEVAFAIQTFCQGATTSTGMAPPVGGIGGSGGIGMLLATTMVGLGGLVWGFRRNRRVALTFATLLLVALGSAACNSLPQGPNGATPAGTYSLSLTTSLNGAPPQTLNNFLTLVVK
jgi:trimeric autotransporter adhesin